MQAFPFFIKKPPARLMVYQYILAIKKYLFHQVCFSELTSGCAIQNGLQR